MLLAGANDVRLGTVPVKGVYAGAVQDWPPFSPASVAGLAVWIDPTQDTFTEGQRIASYTEHSGAGRVLVPDARPEYQPIFHPSGIEFPNPSFGLYSTTDINLGPAGLTFIVVHDWLDVSNYPMVVVSGPDADGFEMRHDGATLQIVERYQTHTLYFSHPTPDGPGFNVHVLRVTSGVRSDVWVNASLHQAGGAAAHNSPQTVYVGRRQGGYYYRGTMAEVLVYAGPVSDANLAKLRDYLRTKWGLP